MTTIAEVKDVFETALQAINLLDQALADERKALKRNAFAEGRPLTDEEVIHRKEIVATRVKLADAMEVLALDTVDALENSSDVGQLIHNINAVNFQLENDLERLKQTEATAAKAAAVAGGMVSVVHKLLGFKAKLV